MNRFLTENSYRDKECQSI